MKDYSKMSDFEINKAVATALGMDVSGATEENNMMYGYVPNICNNPSDAWPIIDSCGICVEFDLSEDGESRWCNASNVSKKISVKYQKNALRAAMIAYLMMKDEDK